jgi:hypothetical protein
MQNSRIRLDTDYCSTEPTVASKIWRLYPSFLESYLLNDLFHIPH